MPPTPTIGTCRPTWRYSIRHTSFARALSGAPLRPPDSAARRRRRQPASADRGVRGHQAARSPFDRRIDGCQQVGGRRIRGKLDQDRNRLTGRQVGRVPYHLLDQRAQRPTFLQIAKAGGVWRADVDDEVVGVRVQHFEGAKVVVRGVFVGRGLVLPEVDSNPNRRRQRSGEVRGDARPADAVEPEAVDDRAIALQPEQPRPWIARLRPGRHRAHFHERKAERRPRRRGRAVLVEPGRKPNRMIEGESKQTSGTSAGPVADAAAPRARARPPVGAAPTSSNRARVQHRAQRAQGERPTDREAMLKVYNRSRLFNRGPVRPRRGATCQSSWMRTGLPAPSPASPTKSSNETKASMISPWSACARAACTSRGASAAS